MHVTHVDQERVYLLWEKLLVHQGLSLSAGLMACSQLQSEEAVKQSHLLFYDGFCSTPPFSDPNHWSFRSGSLTKKLLDALMALEIGVTYTYAVRNEMGVWEAWHHLSFLNERPGSSEAMSSDA